MRTGKALRMGIYQKILYSLREYNVIEPLARGVFHLVNHELPPHVDLITISLLHPEIVFYVITALDFHHITTQIPKTIDVALPQGAKPPNVLGYRLRAFYYSAPELKAGIEIHDVDGFKIKVFCPQKTVFDCFKYSNKIGLNVAIEALKLCIAEKKSRAKDFLQFSRISRVNKRMQPYLEAIYD